MERQNLEHFASPWPYTPIVPESMWHFGRSASLDSNNLGMKLIRAAGSLWRLESKGKAR